MDEYFEQVFDLVSYVFVIESVISQGKPNEVLSSAENLLSLSNRSSQTSIATTHKSTTEIEEQVIQTETALQNEAEQRCTGMNKKSVSRYNGVTSFSVTALLDSLCQGDFDSPFRSCFTEIEILRLKRNENIYLGTVKFEIWKRYIIAVGICLSFSIVFSVFLMQGIYELINTISSLLYLINSFSKCF